MQVEKGFDKLFNYNRSLDESFEYYNTMRNGRISDQISLQGDMLAHEKGNRQMGLDANVNIGSSPDLNQSTDTTDLDLSSALGLFTFKIHGEYLAELRKEKEGTKEEGTK